MADAQAQVERAYDQVVGWFEHFEDLDDPRQSGKVAYPLNEMLLQCLLAVLAGADRWVEIALFGKRNLDFLRRFEAFEPGAPSHDQFGNLFAALDAEAFQVRFIAWVASLTKLGHTSSPSTAKRVRAGHGSAMTVLLSGRRRQGTDPHDLGVLQQPPFSPRPEEGRGQIERDHGDP